MYRVTGTWAGYYLYEIVNLIDDDAVNEAIETIISRFKQADYSLPKCLEGSNIVPNILCITATDESKSAHERKIYKIHDIKL